MRTKTNSPLFRSIGALLALLVMVALPNSLAGPCPQSCAPEWEFYYGISPAPNYVELETIYPSNASIFYTITLDNTANTTDPTHDASGNPTGSTLKVPNGAHVGLAYGHESHFRMLAWSSTKLDSPVVAFSQQNPPN